MTMYEFKKTDLSNLADAALISLVKQGDREAFEVLYDRYSIKLYRQAYAILDDEEEAKDIVQELFVNLWNNVANIHSDVQSIQGYLYISNKNRIFKKLQRFKLKQAHQDYLSHAFQEATASSDVFLEAKEMKSKLDQQIAKLPAKMREIFLLSRDQHMSHKEIAEKLQISDKTVKKQINNALNIIRDNLGLKSGKALILLFLLLFEK